LRNFGQAEPFSVAEVSAAGVRKSTEPLERALHSWVDGIFVGTFLLFSPFSAIFPMKKEFFDTIARYVERMLTAPPQPQKASA